MRTIASVGVFGLLPAALLILFVVHVPRATYAWDFHAFWHAAHEIDHGGNPYSSGGFNVDGQQIPAYVYPPILAELIAPLGFLPFLAAAVCFIAVSAAALVAALRLLDVRDWRCYGATFLWFPTLHGLRLGALSPVLVLALALLVRLERRPPAERGVLAVAVGLKLFLWPLWIWRSARPIAFLSAAGSTVAVVLGSWLLVGFTGLAGYADLLRTTQHQWIAGGYGFATALHTLGVPMEGVSAALFTLAAVGCVWVALLRRRERIDDGEALAALLVIALLFSPVLWLHYAVLLVVPIAMASRTLSLAWCLPLVLWVTPNEESHGAWWRLLLGMLIVAATPLIAVLQARARIDGAVAAQRSSAAVGSIVAPA